jgi:plasmid maintenance system antidote protein VapI
MFKIKIRNIELMSKDTKSLKALAKHVDKLRRDRGLSFQQMALACDMDKGQVYILCTRGANITYLTALKVAKGLEIAVSELLNF